MSRHTHFILIHKSRFKGRLQKTIRQHFHMVKISTPKTHDFDIMDKSQNPKTLASHDFDNN